jgi:hypothetical protein
MRFCVRVHNEDRFWEKMELYSSGSAMTSADDIHERLCCWLEAIGVSAMPAAVHGMGLYNGPMGGLEAGETP